MSLLVEILFGIYLGVLAGIIPALIAGILGFVFKYITNVSIPALAVVIFSAALAGINGGLLALTDPAIASAERFIVASLVVMMLSLYTHSQGDKLGMTMPRYLSLRALRERTFSADVVDMVGGIGEVTITTSSLEDMEGYPAVPPELRQELLEGSWRFPADLPLAELESRLAHRLETTHDLADVSVTLDERARAHIVAAPPSSGLSRRVPSGRRAVSVSALLPTGITRGEEVTVVVGEQSVRGTVLGAGSPTTASTQSVPTPEDESVSPPVIRSAPATAGGEGRVTIAVRKRDANTLLAADRGVVRVQSRGSRREFELVALLRRAGKQFEKLIVERGSLLDGTTIDGGIRGYTEDVTIAAVKRSATDVVHDGRQRWIFSPEASTRLTAGDELFVIGTQAALETFGPVARSESHAADTAMAGDD